MPAQALAMMFVSGAGLALVALLLPGTDGISRVPWALKASLGLPVGALLCSSSSVASRSATLALVVRVGAGVALVA